MDCRSMRGASGKEPRIAWLPMTMNSVSAVTPLDARRMCSSDEIEFRRFAPQNLRNHLIHFIGTFFDDLVPVCASELTTLRPGLQRRRKRGWKIVSRVENRCKKHGF